MNPNAYLDINFIDVKWPNSTWPSNFTKSIRCEFFLARDGNIFSRTDIKDILKSWLHDEFGEIPTNFEFQFAL